MNVSDKNKMLAYSISALENKIKTSKIPEEEGSEQIAKLVKGLSFTDLCEIDEFIRKKKLIK